MCNLPQLSKMSIMKQKNAILPQLRFPQFSAAWEVKKLEEIASVQRGRFSPRPRNNPIYYGGDIPFVQTSDVVKSRGKIAKYSQTLNTKGLGVSRKFKRGTILITIAANIGYTGILEIDMACPDSLVGITPNENVYNYFLHYIFQIERPKMDYLAIAAAQKNINVHFLKTYAIKLPVFAEQQKIGNFLSSTDQCINNLNKQLALWQRYKQGILQQIFNRQLRFKQAKGKDYPVWVEKKLGEIALKKSSSIAANTIKNNMGKYVIYGASGMLKHINFFQEEQMYIGIIKDGAGVGRTLLCEAKSSVLGTLDIIKPKVGVNILFLYYVLGQICFKRYIVGSTIPHIYFNSYKTQKLLLPTLPEQQKIGNFLVDIDSKINHLRTRVAKVQAFKKGLLQQLFV